MKKWYKLVFKQIEPIHIGYKKHGVVNETRIFIPGQTMWGALSNAYGIYHNWTKDDYNKSENKKIFENVSCFYPKIKNKVLYPFYKKGEIHLAVKKENNSYLTICSETKFRNKCTTTLLSTAINPITLNAKDDSLHEIDVILPNNLEWEGYLKVSEEIKNELLRIKRFYIGGDSRYGFGLIELIDVQEENYNQEPKKGIVKKYPNDNEPLTNYVEFNNQKFEGTLEILAEFDFTKNRPKVENAKWYITPGSKIIK